MPHTLRNTSWREEHSVYFLPLGAAAPIEPLPEPDPAWIVFQRRTRGRLRLATLTREWKALDQDTRTSYLSAIEGIQRSEAEVSRALVDRTPLVTYNEDGTVYETHFRLQPETQEAVGNGHAAVRGRRKDLREAWRVFRRLHRTVTNRDLRVEQYYRNTMRQLNRLLQKDERNRKSIWRARPNPATGVDDINTIPILDPHDANNYADLHRQALFPGDNQAEWWVGGWHLGESGQGNAVVWVKQSSSLAIADRVAVKETDCEGIWDDADLWVDDAVGGTPLEAQYMVDLAQTPQSDSIVGLRAYDVDHHAHSLRLYMELCGFGSLDAVFGAYRANQQEQQPVMDDPTARKIPEPFIWYLFRVLVRSVMAMDRLDPPGTNRQRFILHRDLKPMNVFLALPSPSSFPSYPSPKLGDFGSAAVTWHDDPNNPSQWNAPRGCTPGYRPPEIYRAKRRGMTDHYDYRNTPPAHTGLSVWPKLNYATNLWGVGRTLFSLMNHTPVPEQPDWVDLNQGAIRGFMWAGKRYSLELRNLVLQCLAPLPGNRPHLDTLRDEIERNIARDEMTKGMNDHGPAVGPGHKYALRNMVDPWPLNRGFIDVRDVTPGMLLPSPTNLPDDMYLGSDADSDNGTDPADAWRWGSGGAGDDDDAGKDDDDDSSSHASARPVVRMLYDTNGRDEYENQPLPHWEIRRINESDQEWQQRQPARQQAMTRDIAAKQALRVAIRAERLEAQEEERQRYGGYDEEDEEEVDGDGEMLENEEDGD